VPERAAPNGKRLPGQHDHDHDPNGGTATHDANQSTCATAIKGCDSTYNLFRSFGYTGSKNVTYQDLWNWAVRAKVGWVNLCFAFFGQDNFDACGTDPFNHQTDLWKSPPMDWWKFAQTTAAGASFIACGWFSAGACWVSGGVGLGVDIGSEAAHGESATTILQNSGETIIVFVLARVTDGSLEVKPLPKQVEAAKGTPFEEYENFTFMGNSPMAASVRRAVALGENIYVSWQIYQAGGASATEVTGGGN
jgi:hypothetical protein